MPYTSVSRLRSRKVIESALDAMHSVSYISGTRGEERLAVMNDVETTSLSERNFVTARPISRGRLVKKPSDPAERGSWGRCLKRICSADHWTASEMARTIC